jgi:hypothetical protein
MRKGAWEQSNAPLRSDRASSLKIVRCDVFSDRVDYQYSEDAPFLIIASSDTGISAAVSVSQVPGASTGRFSNVRLTKLSMQSPHGMGRKQRPFTPALDSLETTRQSIVHTPTSRVDQAGGHECSSHSLHLQMLE